MKRLAWRGFWLLAAAVSWCLEAYFWALRTVSRRLEGFAEGAIKSRLDNRTTTVTHGSARFTFHTPNRITTLRARTFSTKEPETLDWIDRFGGDGPFFDIGANVGIYSVYFGLTKTGKIVAFEPSVFNLPLLAKNMRINGLETRTTIVSNALSDGVQLAKFSLSSVEEGGALSAFGVDYGSGGRKLDTKFTYQTLGFSLDWLFQQGVLVDYPELVKIDVDGIEHLILGGARQTIAHQRCKSVLVETDLNFPAQKSAVEQIMRACGFELMHRPVQAGLPTRNDIWLKKPAPGSGAGRDVRSDFARGKTI